MHNKTTSQKACFCFRSVIKPTDLGRFDEMISPHELKALREHISESDSDNDSFDDVDFTSTNEGS